MPSPPPPSRLVFRPRRSPLPLPRGPLACSSMNPADDGRLEVADERRPLAHCAGEVASRVRACITGWLSAHCDAHPTTGSDRVCPSVRLIVSAGPCRLHDRRFLRVRRRCDTPVGLDQPLPDQPGRVLLDVPGLAGARVHTRNTARESSRRYWASPCPASARAGGGQGKGEYPVVRPISHPDARQYETRPRIVSRGASSVTSAKPASRIRAGIRGWSAR